MILAQFNEGDPGFVGPPSWAAGDGESAWGWSDVNQGIGALTGLTRLGVELYRASQPDRGRGGGSQIVSGGSGMDPTTLALMLAQQQKAGQTPGWVPWAVAGGAVVIALGGAALLMR